MATKKKTTVRTHARNATAAAGIWNMLFGEIGTGVFRTVLTIMGGVTLWLFTTTANKFETMEKTLTTLSENVPKDLQEVKKDVSSLQSKIAEIENKEQNKYIELISRLTKIETLTSFDTPRKKQ